MAAEQGGRHSAARSVGVRARCDVTALRTLATNFPDFLHGKCKSIAGIDRARRAAHHASTAGGVWTALTKTELNRPLSHSAPVLAWTIQCLPTTELTVHS